MTAIQQVLLEVETEYMGHPYYVPGHALYTALARRVDAEDAQASAPEAVEAAVRERVDEHVRLSVHATEAAVLQAVGGFAADRLRDDDVLLVAYNGERWQDGFDLPFLRTRLAATDVEWPFRGMPYADLLPVVTRRFNLVVDSDERLVRRRETQMNGLSGVSSRVMPSITSKSSSKEYRYSISSRSMYAAIVASPNAKPS